ncbi:MAG: hypothetical protein JSU75_01475, partial [Gammaproteobacteria bacterium]
MTATRKASAAEWFAWNRAGVLISCLLGTAAVNAAWFKNPEQEAAQKYAQGEYSDAADEFTDAYRRGVA